MPLANETRMTRTKRIASTGLNGVVVDVGELRPDMTLTFNVVHSMFNL